MTNNTYYTHESVAPGHPDKIADLISDKILDHYISLEQNSKVAIETMVKDHDIYICGESTGESIELAPIVKDVFYQLGYQFYQDLDIESLNIISNISKQSDELEIDQNTIGAGDQGSMVGYATNESQELLPYGMVIAHKIMKNQAKIVHSNSMLLPDAKCQVLIDGHNQVQGVVLSTQHKSNYDLDKVRDLTFEKVILPVLPELQKHQAIINPKGKFTIGGPIADCGVTGRKIMVDSYGNTVPHGGGAFSGKDATKVDRSGAYMARYVAKNIVARSLADKCQITVAYVIGQSKPYNIQTTCFGTEKIPMQQLNNIINNIDWRPKAIIEQLNLLRPIYKYTTNFGHFDQMLPWEQLDLQL